VGIDYVLGTRAREQQPDSAGFGFIESDDIDVGQPKEGGEARLTPRIATTLGQRSLLAP